MKAAVLNSFSGQFDIEELEIDEPRGSEVLVEVRAAGLCHSDLHMASHDYGTPLPAVFGHELAGVVAQIGPDVRGFQIGDHVVGSLLQSCGHCSSCVGGLSYQCDDPDSTLRAPSQGHRLFRHGRPVTQVFGTGGFAEFSLIHEQQLARVPKEMPFAQACILGCSTVTGAGAVLNTAQLRVGDSMAVIGAGGVGLNAIAAAKLAGAREIIAIDILDSKLETAEKFGATHTINSAKTEAVTALRTIAHAGVDHVFEVVGLKSTSEQAIQMCRKGGSTYLIGAHRPGAKIEIDVNNDLLIGQRRVIGVWMGSSNIKNDIPKYAELYLQGQFDLDSLISRTINISEINEAYSELSSGTIARSVITSF
ncbi:Zn-dependent alcohol dehydrogenase [Pseudomonas sp. BN505]|uniref:Zn-dependent alcohol dehydrogenase n=1 Tax=unclassified Pseudomonas TaxID=196821 RepID=UPI00245574EC|nr:MULTISPECIES: Zn-dependent alcohol dehydrogenase [unclassified Pseudomonas]MDH4842262.1 Zn-dependent alcohol dehydrogenase [Pseudomonas sp. BN605]MDH4855117.1 Zn-dependent alcohol dehydrogenase [Pseudomonas sp. BN505]